MKSSYEVQPDDIVGTGSSQEHLAQLAHRAQTILDVGCSSGGLAALLMAQGKTVVGIDVDEAAVASARAAGLEAHVADVQRADLASIVGERRFDCVIFGDILEHLVDPGAVLGAARGVLTPDGFILVSVPNVANASMRLALLTNRWDGRDMGLLDRTHLRFFTLDTFLDLADACGLMATSIQRVRSDVRDPLQEPVLAVRDAAALPQWIVDAAHFGGEADVLQFVMRLEPIDQSWTDLDAARTAAVKSRIELRDALRQLVRARSYEERAAEIEGREREQYLEGLQMRDAYIGLSARLASAEERAREAEFHREYARAELDAIYASRAWRIGRACTLPMRALRHLLRGARSG